MDAQCIQRLNELSRLSRERSLTSAEEVERASLRKAYIRNSKASLEAQIRQILVQRDDGTISPLRKRSE